VDCALFETTAFLVGQHMAQKAVTGVAAAPMPARVSAWAVYDVFDTGDGDQVFIGVVSDGQWKAFCAEFALADWAADELLAQNNQRIKSRDVIMPRLRDLFKSLPKAEILTRCEAAGLPFAPITRPEELFDDPHLLASEGLIEVATRPGDEDPKRAALPALPLRMAAQRPGLHHDVPWAGEHTHEVLTDALGLSAAEIAALEAAGAVG
jgi:crotonobetainyl-CoA:carnitine CoA-transferase CaiB-like acyl-CoA transferase